MSLIIIDKISVDQFPTDEDDYYEYKSSLTDHNALKDKLQKSISGFANSGGGFFVYGLDDKTGKADGGIRKQIGNKPLFDWVDTVLSQVEPTPKYSLKLLDDVGERGFLYDSHVILVVAVDESNVGPHMAPDCRYYIRAGKHTVPARHFIVEAIRAKRFNSKPKLSHVFRLKPGHEQVLQLGLIAITNSPAINVVLSLNPLPTKLQKRAKDFPIKLPLVDQNNPFFFDVALYAESEETFGNNININIEYYDLLQNHYKQELTTSIESTPPIIIGNRDKKLLEALDTIDKSITRLRTP